MNEDRYVFRGLPEERATAPLAPLPEGDYPYIVAETGLPYFKNDKWILAVKLIIDVPHKPYVFAHPWTGRTSSGEERDGIAEFLSSSNRTPPIGQEPDWNALVNARGKVHLAVEVAQAGKYQGKEVNRVAWWHFPHELNKPALSKLPQAGPKPPPDLADDDLDLRREPGDIPF